MGSDIPAFRFGISRRMHSQGNLSFDQFSDGMQDLNGGQAEEEQCTDGQYGGK